MQQVFSKYDQHQLREIAGTFSELMNLMYKEQKVDYEIAKAFTRLKEELPKSMQVEKIVLLGKNTALRPESESPQPK